MSGSNEQNITLIRQAFDKVKFNQTVDTSFTQLGVVEPDLSFFDPNLATVEDFFSIYSNLFFLIPKFGVDNSHEYLIKTSSERIDYLPNQAEIEALLDEITELREQNLQLVLDMGNILGAQEEIDTAIASARNSTN